MRVSEKKIQQDIMAALGAEPGLILMRNNNAMLPLNDGSGRFIRSGLGDGSPDLVGILSITCYVHNEPCKCTWPAQWFCLEVKRPEDKKPDAHQEACHKAWRAMGAFVCVVVSVDEARAALVRARRGEHQ